MIKAKPAIGPLVGLLAICATAQTPAFADAYTDSRMLASQCAQCHGTNGQGGNGIDSLAGEEYFDLLDKLRDMARPGETGEVMKFQAKGYTDQQLMLIALYFSSLPKPSGH